MPVCESFLHDRLKVRWTVGSTGKQSTKVFSAKSLCSIIYTQTYVHDFTVHTQKCMYTVVCFEKYTYGHTQLLILCTSFVVNAHTIHIYVKNKYK